MFFDTVQFKAMTSSLQALSLQQQMSLQNLANYETPNYKAKYVTFEDALKGATVKQNGAGEYQFKARVLTDTETTVRPDGNNVDSDAESARLFQSYLQSMYLQQKITGEITNMRYVLTNGPR